MGDRKEIHFVLIHGACHGAWCWYKLMTLLRSNGHRVTALDLAASGIHPKRVEELNSFSDYNDPLMEFMADLPPVDRAILVGHSFGGLNISLAMEKFPKKIAVAVFITAVMPSPDLNMRTIYQEYLRQSGSDMDSQYEFSNGEDKPPTTHLFGPNFLSSKLYQLSPSEDLSLATLLVRPRPVFDEEQLLKDTELTNGNYGSVPRVYIISDQDNAIKEELQRWIIEKNPANEVKVIPDSDHMIMLSKPRELCTCLEQISQNYTDSEIPLYV